MERRLFAPVLMSRAVQHRDGRRGVPAKLHVVVLHAQTAIFRHFSAKLPPVFAF